MTRKRVFSRVDVSDWSVPYNVRKPVRVESTSGGAEVTYTTISFSAFGYFRDVTSRELVLLGTDEGLTEFVLETSKFNNIEKGDVISSAGIDYKVTVPPLVVNNRGFVQHVYLSFEGRSK